MNSVVELPPKRDFFDYERDLSFFGPSRVGATSASVVPEQIGARFSFVVAVLVTIIPLALFLFDLNRSGRGRRSRVEHADPHVPINGIVHRFP